jgi:acetylornithine deacetylase
MQISNSKTYINIEKAHFVPGLQPEVNGFAEALVRQITRRNNTAVVSYGTEAGQFQQAGYSTIICGPGSIKQAHQANEYIDVLQLEKGELFISELIKSLC